MTTTSPESGHHLRGSGRTMVGVLSVFVCSVQHGYSAIRGAVRRAIEILHMRPLMAELVGARPESPQRALLDHVAEADVLVLIIGAQYSGPTEDEFNEARRLGRPIVVLKQRVELEPEQQAFLDRVAAGWVGGRMWAEFDDERDVLEVAVEALSHLGQDRRRAELGPPAQERAAVLAAGERRHGYAGHRSTARVALVPLVSSPVFDALSLVDELGESVATLARSARLVPHSVGIDSQVRGEGVTLRRAEGGYSGEAGFVTVGADGSIAAEIDVGGDSTMAGTRVDSALLARGIEDVGSFALAVWNAIDRREEVQQVAAAVAILDAQHKVFDLAPDATSYSMGRQTLTTVVVPEPPAVVRRAEVAGTELAQRLVAEARRVFADAGATA
ncbi:MAG TPA: DUF4062 domain-containing protein [Gaiellaceae bacterium]|nr:DUF4062 domain-containing protein [Gaiellaceae bacterium]